MPHKMTRAQMVAYKHLQEMGAFSRKTAALLYNEIAARNLAKAGVLNFDGNTKFWIRQPKERKTGGLYKRAELITLGVSVQEPSGKMVNFILVRGIYDRHTWFMEKILHSLSSLGISWTRKNISYRENVEYDSRMFGGQHIVFEYHEQDRAIEDRATNIRKARLLLHRLPLIADELMRVGLLQTARSMREDTIQTAGYELAELIEKHQMPKKKTEEVVSSTH